MAVPFEHDAQRLTCGFSEELPEKGREDWAEYERSGEAARKAKANYTDSTNPIIRSLLDNIDDTSVRLWAPYSIPDLPTWHKGRVCLIGDAAHALPPNGQGSAQAFEDVAIMSRLLTSDSAVAQGYENLFSEFEKARRPRIELVKQFTNKSVRQTKGTASGPWAWWAKTWAIYAFFAWNRWVMRQPKITSYNALAEPLEGKTMD